MTDNTIFEMDSGTTFDDPGVEPSNEALLDTLVGEGKKFKDAEALAKGKILADAHIKRVQEEAAELRRRLELLEGERASSKKVDDILRAINTSRTGSTVEVIDAETGGEGTRTVDLSPDLIAEQVIAKIEKRQHANTETENVKRVAFALKEKFGANWQNRLREYGNTIGLDEGMIDTWVKKNPQAVIDNVIKSAPKPPTPDVTPVFRSASLPATSGVRNNAYYMALKAKDSKTFWSNEVQLAMHADALKQGEKFFAKE